MNGHELNPQLDPLLSAFLETSSETEARRQLDQLVAQAVPVIKKITRSGRAPEDAFQETTQRVIKQLWDLRANPDGNGISNYLHYVKVVASHVVKSQVREEHPQHRSMVDALRHALKRDPTLAMWESDTQDKLCGLAAWRHQQTGLTRSERLMRLIEEPRTFEGSILPGCDAASLGHAELLAQLFHWLGHPIKFDELVRIVGDLRRIEGFTWVVDDEAEGRPLGERLPDPGPRPDEQAEWGQLLERLWEQIEQLPHWQRLAYLLNFTAADGQLELFWIYGVATIRRIGAVLQLTEEQLARAWPELGLSDRERRASLALENYDDKFALLWQHLPLTDAAIAKILGTERQKVINLRKAAGNRLSRRLAHRDRQA